MKQFELKVVPIDGDSAGRRLNYRDELSALVKNFPDGVSIAEMGDAIAIAQKLRNAKDESTIFLEDAEHAYLIARMANNRFTIAAQEIVDMSRALSEAKPVSMPHAVNGKQKRG
jgi:hypothetical protein